MHDLRNAPWRTSSHSLGGKACVEVADLPGGHCAVRDSKNRSGPALMFPAAEWAAFTAGIRVGDFD